MVKELIRPMACCFSGFKQLFASGQQFTYGLQEIGTYYRNYVDLMDHWDKVLRLQAELENLRKRTLKDIESASRGSIERVFQEILPIMDSFELGMKVDTSNKEGIETFIEGQTATYKQFQSVLDKFLIETINPENMKFDAELHEVMTIQESDEVESGYIIEVIQKGYRLKNRLLRPARVIVSSDKKK